MPRLAHYTLRHATPDPITGGTVSELFGRHYWHGFDARGDSAAVEQARAFIRAADPARVRTGDVWELHHTPKSKHGQRAVATFDYPHGDTTEPRALRAPTAVGV